MKKRLIHGSCRIMRFVQCPEKCGTTTLFILCALLSALCIVSNALAAPDVPEITGPELSTQPPAYTVEWTDESASGAASYVVKRTPSTASEHTVTAYGDAGIAGPQMPPAGVFGDAKEFNGTSDYVSYADSSNWDIFANTTDNWTVSFFYKFNQTDVAHTFFAQKSTSGTAGYYVLIYNKSSNKIVLYQDLHVLFESPTLTLDTNWHHLAFVKNTDTLALYLDGIQIAYGVTFTQEVYNSLFSIGAHDNDNNGVYGQYLNGYLDEFQVQKSNCFNASPQSNLSDTITVPTAPYTSDANTKLLEHFDSVKQFATQTCAFDGSGDYLSVPDSSDWDIVNTSSDQWTIDFWMKSNEASTCGIFSQSPPSGTSIPYYYFGIRNGEGKLFFYVHDGTAVSFEGVTNVCDNEWHHVVLYKTGTTYAMYLDGRQDGYAVITKNINVPGFATLGRRHLQANEHYYDGYLDDFRVEKANPFNANPNSEKTNTIVVPIAPHQPDENTKLYLSFDGYIQDESRSILTTTTSNELAQSNMEDGTYDYRVRAVDGDSYSSAYSSALTLTVDSSIPVLALNSVTPTKNRWYEADELAYTANATGSNALYQFLLGATVVQDYSTASVCSYQLQTTDLGRHTVTVNVKDDYNTEPLSDQFDVYVYRRPNGA